MYEYITGKLTHIQPTYLVVNAGGIGYRLLCANPFRWQKDLQQEITCYVELVVREDSQTLYAFKDMHEKQLFLTLNKVSGIGPKSALSILAADDHQGLIQAIESGDSKYLTKFPGVGKKTAQQMVLDLKGELDLSEAVSVGDAPQVAANHIMTEVVEALLGLGYSAKEVKRIEKPLAERRFTTTQEALSAAFKLLLK
ncbi:Holliday junction branch migration protein RuvA [Aerococcaceae bacterium NML190073]|nr:Holliday junction branch migration protein RuvA [Aerococcaceae bacterium NML190073]MCW6674413.1 Holliday junction branch migration protein RuvA [Aerococcaceae bacterium NML171108]